MLIARRERRVTGVDSDTVMGEIGDNEQDPEVSRKCDKEYPAGVEG